MPVQLSLDAFVEGLGAVFASRLHTVLLAAMCLFPCALAALAWLSYSDSEPRPAASHEDRRGATPAAAAVAPAAAAPHEKAD
jgi:hypothetical protein